MFDYVNHDFTYFSLMTSTPACINDDSTSNHLELLSKREIKYSRMKQIGNKENREHGPKFRKEKPEKGECAK